VEIVRQRIDEVRLRIAAGERTHKPKKVARQARVQDVGREERHCAPERSEAAGVLP
jgi:hypothetical protein